MNKSSTQVEAEQNSLRAEERYQEGQLTEARIVYEAEVERINKVRKQHDLLKNFDDSLFVKTQPDFEYEKEPAFRSLMKDLVLSGGLKEIATGERKLAQMKEGIERETVRLNLIKSGISMRKIGDSDIDKELQKN